MSSFNLSPEMMRSIIMDHYQYPHNKRHEASKDYFEIHQESESCVDDIFVMAKIKDGVIEDVCFDGVACAISTAATSVMTDLLKGKSVDEAEKIIKNYNNMIFEKPYDAELLGEGIAFQNVHKQANRIRCATIGWDGISKLIEQSKQGKK